MKKSLPKLLLATVVLALLLTGCGAAATAPESNDADTDISINNRIINNTNEAEPFFTTAVAYPLSEDEQNALKLEKSDRFLGENILEYTNEKGETVLRIYSAPIETSENAITHNENGDYYGKGKFIEKILPVLWSAENPISVTQQSNYAEIMPADISEYSSERVQTINMFGQICDSVIYKNVFGEGIDLTCSFTSFGVNMEIVFNEHPKQNTYQIKLKLPGLVPDTGSPDYILFKAALDEVGARSILETPLAADKNGNWSYANSVRLTDKDSKTGTYTVEFTIDEVFMSNEATTYPVAATHSVSLYKVKQPDTSVYENTGDEAGHYLSPYMLVGDSTIKGEAWTYVRYETLYGMDISPAKVISARYVFRNLFTSPKEVTIGAYAVTADWCSRNTRWFNRPTNNENPISQVTVQKASDYSLDITEHFKEMIKNRNKKDEAEYSVRNSFMIKSNTENSSLIFPSGDGGLFSPYLEVVLMK